MHAARAQSLSGALELACAGDAAAREFFAARGESGRIAAIEKAAAEERGRLSREGVRAIYGQKLYLTASRIDNFASCRFQFFLRYGLCAKPRQSAQFAPPERGTFSALPIGKCGARGVGARRLCRNGRQDRRRADGQIRPRICAHAAGGFSGKEPPVRLSLPPSGGDIAAHRARHGAGAAPLRLPPARL